ncbi:MAG: hypothetical protein V1934_02935 [Methanobacteriota archaeon]
MNRRGHVLFTLILTAAAIYALDRYYIDLPYAIMALGVGEAVFLSALPDILEPGGRSDHRGGFHSWRALAACLIISGIGLYLMPDDLWRHHAVLFVPWGFATHLMADALTPAGLPY